MTLQQRLVGCCEDDAQIGIFIDDKSSWLESLKKHVGKALPKFKEFVEGGDKVDKILGCELHPDKGEWAASMRCGHLQLLKWDTIPAVVKFEIKVLGVTYSFTQHRRRPADQKQWAKMHARLATQDDAQGSANED